MGTVTRLLALVVGVCATSCTLDPTRYEDPPEQDAASFDTVGGGADISFSFDSGLFDSGGSDVAAADDVVATEDVVDAEDVADAADVVDAEDGAATADGGTADDTAVDVGPSTCSCAFTYPATSPLAQSYVRLTGDFVSTPWTTEVAAGAVELVFSAADNAWATSVQLSDGQTIAYKYVMGWPDNPGPVWANQQGDMDGGAPDSTLTVICGVVPCDG